MKKLSIIAISLTILFLMGCQKITTPTSEVPQRITGDIQTGTIEEITGSVETGFIIQSFEDCLNAGFPIMESYPRQCNDGTTTHVEEITQNLSGEENVFEDVNLQQTGEITTKQENSTGDSLNILQQKLKAMMERRNQQTQSGNTTNSEIINTTTKTTTTNEQVTEEDIENLENLINEIIKK